MFAVRPWIGKLSIGPMAGVGFRCPLILLSVNLIGFHHLKPVRRGNSRYRRVQTPCLAGGCQRRHRYSKQSKPDTPLYLSEHQICGATLVAASVFFEMAQACARETFGESTRAIEGFVIQSHSSSPKRGARFRSIFNPPMAATWHFQITAATLRVRKNGDAMFLAGWSEQRKAVTVRTPKQCRLTGRSGRSGLPPPWINIMDDSSALASSLDLHSAVSAKLIEGPVRPCPGGASVISKR